MDRGTNIADITRDLDGNARQFDGNYDGIVTHDIGCYEFVPPQLQVAVTAGANGSVVPTGVVSVVKGTGTGFWINADLDYHVAGITTNGTDVGEPMGCVATNYCWNRIMSSGTLAARFDVNRTAAGIPHPWLTLYGMTNKSDSAEGENPDGDPYDNLQEYVTGTDPTNAESHLRFSIQPSDLSGVIELRIDPTFTDRVYTVFSADDLLTADWQTHSCTSGSGGPWVVPETNDVPIRHFKRKVQMQ